MELKSSFKLPYGTKEYFTIPVIHRGVLYIRHQDALLAFHIEQN
jgi:outer membrane protein assembly factor BamB